MSNAGQKFAVGDLAHFKVNDAYFGLCIVTGYGKNFFKDGQYIVVSCLSGEIYIAFDYELYTVEEFKI